ncbi:hypothetical protein QFZ23_002032 [Arthrobacter globiformis]|nr:hypothetical protein [Arthrobacter globiformis]
MPAPLRGGMLVIQSSPPSMSGQESPLVIRSFLSVKRLAGQAVGDGSFELFGLNPDLEAL